MFSDALGQSRDRQGRPTLINIVASANADPRLIGANKGTQGTRLKTSGCQDIRRKCVVLMAHTAP